ncbi:MAG: hypothetical protein LRY73_12315 [Bacillus sp. (in: Bacteria)]|nr:hypothetical protein [Bacillus sp. (in: firmicutes)]
MKKSNDHGPIDRKLHKLNELNMTEEEKTESFYHVMSEIKQEDKRTSLRFTFTRVSATLLTASLFVVTVWFISDVIGSNFQSGEEQTPPVDEIDPIDSVPEEREEAIFELEEKPPLEAFIDGKLHYSDKVYLAQYDQVAEKWVIEAEDVTIFYEENNVIFQREDKEFTVTIGEVAHAHIEVARLSPHGIMALQISDSQNGPKYIYLVDMEEEKKIASITNEVMVDYDLIFSISGFSWSPNEQFIAMGVGGPVDQRLGIYHMETGELEILHPHIFSNILEVRWTLDGDAIDVVDGPSEEFHLYRFSLEERKMYELYEVSRDEFMGVNDVVIINETFMTAMEKALRERLANEEAIEEFRMDLVERVHGNTFLLYYSVKPLDPDTFVLAGSGREGEDGWIVERVYYVTVEEDGSMSFSTSP